MAEVAIANGQDPEIASEAAWGNERGMLIALTAIVGFGPGQGTRVTIRARGGQFTLEGHPLMRMAERGPTVKQVQAAIENGESFLYFREGAWKTGFYDPNSRIFVGSIENRITTVITNVGANQIAKMKAAKP